MAAEFRTVTDPLFTNPVLNVELRMTTCAPLSMVTEPEFLNIAADMSPGKRTVLMPWPVEVRVILPWFSTVPAMRITASVTPAVMATEVDAVKVEFLTSSVGVTGFGDWSCNATPSSVVSTSVTVPPRMIATSPARGVPPGDQSAAVPYAPSVSFQIFVVMVALHRQVSDVTLTLTCCLFQGSTLCRPMCRRCLHLTPNR